MRPEKIKSIVENKNYSDEDAAGMTGLSVEEVRKIRTPAPKPTPAPKAAPKKGGIFKKK